MAAPKKYPDALRARAVKLYRESSPKALIRKLAEQSLRAKEEHERHVALALQAALLPGTLRRHPSIDLEIRYRAAVEHAAPGLARLRPPAGFAG